MEHNNSHEHHPNHPVDDEHHSRRGNNNDAQGSLAPYAVVNHYGQHIMQPHPYGSTHHAGGQLQQYQQPNNYLQHHYYNNPNQNTWQWMPVAIPPPPPPPPPLPISSMGSNVSSPSIPTHLDQGQGESQTKRRKRRWGPGVNEQQSVSEEPSLQASAVVKKDSTEPTVMKEEINSTDNAIDAINALSTLESRWDVPQKKKKTRRKRRRKKKGTPSNSDQTNLDVEDMHNVWIDVEDVVKIMNPSQSMKQEMIKSSDKTLEGADAMDFPPLKSETNEEEEKIKTTSQTTERDINAMDTSELKSYADVLSKALGSASKHPSSYNDDSEMDISEEEEENSDETTGPEIVTKSSPDDVCVETSTDQSAVAKGRADEDDAKREKEKRALKLAELKAKAKLANAKLRMALQRKAMGNTPKDTKTSIVANSNGRNTPTYNVASHQTKKPWQSSAPNVPVPTPRDISALRNIKTLVIPDVSGTGPDEMVRFIDSIYNLSSSEDDDSSENVEEEEEDTILEDPPDAKVALPTNESQKKSHQSLKQQLQLAKLRLEIKRKEQLLLEKKRKMPVVTVATDSKMSSNNVSSAIDVTNAPEEDCNDRSEDKAKPINNEPDVKISSEEKREKLEKLRQRQKELKQKNEISHLKNMINRQRQLLRTQGQELTDSSAQLEDVVRDITSKQTLLDESSKKLEEMNHRKKIMEGMMLRATEKLMKARKALGQHKQRSVTT